MTKKMLIDDTRREETRVVVMDGNKIEEIEFETSSRRQIKGNVYLAKVMRVEPSLQAAFVEYGGNRHGFLAFSEIHPDYYQVSDAVLAEIDKEVDEAIEKKKQQSKEREQFEAQNREGRARRAAEKAAERKEAAEQKAEKQEKAKGAEAETVAEKPKEEIKGEGEAEAQAKEEEPKDGKPVKKRLAKKRMRREKEKDRDVVLASADSMPGDDPVPGAEAASPARVDDKAVSQSLEKAENETDSCPLPARKPKALAADSDLAEPAVHEEVRRHNGNDSDRDDIDSDDDDDDDSEAGYEAQRRLMKVRKLFHRSRIQDVVREGQILLVQVVKEERGNKGAALTTYLSLAGRYCVLMPNRIKSGGVSRKITNMADRRRLKTIIRSLPLTADMSMIVRTAGEGKSEAEIVRDYNYLMHIWNQIRIGSLKAKAPALIHEEGNLIKRALRDICNNDIAEIVIDGDEAFKTARDFMQILSPNNVRKIKANRKGDLPLFQKLQIESQLDKLHDTTVALPSGGSLVINPTEALVAIDVNSGRATKERDIEETALKTNLEAADEIARQLRMRNLAGLIVVDFIDMDEGKNNAAVEKRMKEAMKADRARVQIGRMSQFGLMEISRQRMHSSFFESNYHTCPHCQGRGLVRTVESSAVMVLRLVEEEGARGRTARVSVCLPADIAVYLLNEHRKALGELEAKYAMGVVICADPAMKNVAEHRVERVKREGTSAKTPRLAEIEEAVEAEKPAENKENAENRGSADDRNSGDRNDRRRDRGRHGRGRDRDGRDNRDSRDRDRSNSRDNRDNREHRGQSQPQPGGQPTGERKGGVAILYNSHGDAAAPAPASEPKNADKQEGKKGGWWKKLIP